MQTADSDGIIKNSPEMERFLDFGAVYSDEVARLRENRQADLHVTEQVQTDNAVAIKKATPAATATKVMGARKNKYGSSAMSAKGVSNVKNGKK